MAAPLVEIERAVVRTCFAPEASALDLRALGDERAWGIYRELVRTRLLGEYRQALPRTARAAGAEAFERVFAAHLAEDPPRTRFFREVVLCFARSALQHFRADASLPAYLGDLCAWEAARWEVGDLDDRVEPGPGEFAFDRPAALAPAMRLLCVAYAVHEPPGADGAYVPRELCLCVHRRAEERRVRTWVLAPLGYALLERLARGTEPVSEAIRAVAVETGSEPDARFVDRACGMLADFLERGFVLGAR